MTGGQWPPPRCCSRRHHLSPGARPRRERLPHARGELLATLAAPAYITRVSVAKPKYVAKAAAAVKRAFQTRSTGRAFLRGDSFHLPHQLGHAPRRRGELGGREDDPLLSPRGHQGTGVRRRSASWQNSSGAFSPPDSADRECSRWGSSWPTRHVRRTPRHVDSFLRAGDARRHRQLQCHGERRGDRLSRGEQGGLCGHHEPALPREVRTDGETGRYSPVQ